LQSREKIVGSLFLSIGLFYFQTCIAFGKKMTDANLRKKFALLDEEKLTTLN